MAYSFGSNSLVDDIIYGIITDTIDKIGFKKSISIDGIYLNYYRNGSDWCPSHSHKDTKQLVISIGCTRTFKIGKKEYELNNNDAIIFGSSAHEILQDESIKKGRISIAVFYKNI